MVDPLDLDARVYKAICLGRLGGIQNTADAIGEYKFVLETDENYYLALYHFGSLLVALNDVSGAIFYFQRLIMVDPESIEALLVTARAHCLRYLQTIQQSANQVGIMVTAPTSPGTSAEGTSSPSKPTSRVGQGSADVKLISNAIDDLKRAMRCYEQLVGLDEVQPMTDIYECIVEDVAMIASDLTNQLAKLATARK
jgi:tetratricopeptide (TPR) repeat protein